MRLDLGGGHERGGRREELEAEADDGERLGERPGGAMTPGHGAEYKGHPREDAGPWANRRLAAPAVRSGKRGPSWRPAGAPVPRATAGLPLGAARARCQARGHCDSCRSDPPGVRPRRGQGAQVRPEPPEARPGVTCRPAAMRPARQSGPWARACATLLPSSESHQASLKISLSEGREHPSCITIRREDGHRRLAFDAPPK